MNTTRESHRKTFSCRLVQGWAAWSGGDHPDQGNGFVATHVGRCDCCREHFARNAELEGLLRREGVQARSILSSEIDAHYLRNIRNSADASRQPAAAIRPAMLWLSGCAAALAVLVAITQMRSPNTDLVLIEPADQAEEWSETVVISADGWWTDLRPSAGDLLEAEPLQREVDAVVSDARSALGFLALNFLPGSELTGGIRALGGNTEIQLSDG